MAGRFIKSKLKKQFTTVPNEFLRRKDLSWKAKGLLTYLLGMDEDWVVYKQDLANRSTDGYESTVNGFKELVEMGYIKEIKTHDEVSKKFTGYDYMVSDHPILEDNPVIDFPATEKPVTGFPEPENRQLRKTSNKKKLLKENLNINVDSKEPTLHQLLCAVWLLEIHPGWTFEAVHGRTITTIGNKIKKLQKDAGRPHENADIENVFRVMCQRLPEWYKDKDLQIINGKFNEIITEIKNGKSTTSNKFGAQRSKYGPQ